MIFLFLESLTVELLHLRPVYVPRRALEHSVVVLVAVQKNPELGTHESEHELDVAGSVSLLDGLEGASVVDVVDLTEDGGFHGKEVASVNDQTLIFGLRKQYDLD